MKKWKIIKETDVSPSRWFPVIQHTVELPDGNIIDDFFISPIGDVVMILPVTSKNEIVLVKQYRHGTGEIMLELPAGYLQKGKSLEKSALAELEEETGIKTSIDNLILLGKTANNPTKTNHICYCYLAKNLEFNSKQKLDKTEQIEIVKVTPNKALEMAISGKIWVTDTAVNIFKLYFSHPEIFK